MNSPKKRTHLRAALSAAAAATLAARSAPAAVSLTMYYGQDTSYANSNNSVLISSSYDPASPNLNVQGETQYFLSPTSVSIAPGATTPQTIVVPAGDYLSLAVDAVLTGNTNPSGGLRSIANRNQVQPAYMGLTGLAMAVSSTDTTGAHLTPLPAPTETPGFPDAYYNDYGAYLDTATINQSFGANGGGYNATPAWAISGVGDVFPDKPGFTGNHTEGSVGLFNGAPAFLPAGGNVSVTANSAAGISRLEQFAASNNVASYSNATDFFDSLIFQALSPGVVTLNPFVITNATLYWANTSVNPTSTSVATSYAAQPGYTTNVQNVPQLVIDITPAPASGIISVTQGPSVPQLGYGKLITNGPGTDQGSFSPSADELYVIAPNGFSPAQVTGINGGAGAAVDSVETALFDSATAPQYFALDVLVNGSQATPSELATLVSAINSGDADVPASLGVLATTTAPVINPFPAGYNLYLETSGYRDEILGINMSSAFDPNLVGYTFSAVAAIPEPTALGLLTIGAIGLARRRPHASPAHAP